MVELCEAPHHRDGRGFEHLYPDEMPLWDKMRTIAREIYGAEDIIADQRVRDQFKEYQAAGYGHFPICVAKTQYSFSTDPSLKGAPIGHVVPDPRAAPGRRRRVPGGDLRRDHDHARPAHDRPPPSASASTRTARSRGCSRGLVAPAPQGRSRGKHAMSSETAPASAGPWLHGASA